jgi:hypothetical protein
MDCRKNHRYIVYAIHSKDYCKSCSQRPQFNLKDLKVLIRTQQLNHCCLPYKVLPLLSTVSLKSCSKMLQLNFERNAAIKHTTCNDIDHLDEMQRALIYGLSAA